MPSLSLSENFKRAPSLEESSLVEHTHPPVVIMGIVGTVACGSPASLRVESFLQAQKAKKTRYMEQNSKNKKPLKRTLKEHTPN